MVEGPESRWVNLMKARTKFRLGGRAARGGAGWGFLQDLEELEEGWGSSPARLRQEVEGPILVLYE